MLNEFDEKKFIREFTSKSMISRATTLTYLTHVIISRIFLNTQKIHWGLFCGIMKPGALIMFTSRGM